ncbi:VOC family protein, partial [Streptomyces clavifer]
MAARIDLTLDCADAKLLAEFWKTALGYADEPPPAPFGTREEWLAQFDLPEDDSADGGACPAARSSSVTGSATSTPWSPPGCRAP